MRISDWSSDVCSSDLLLGSEQDRGVMIFDDQCDAAEEVFAQPVDQCTRTLHPDDRLRRDQMDRGRPLGQAPDHARMANAPRVDDAFGEEVAQPRDRSEEHTSELQSLLRTSYAVFCLQKKKQHNSKHQYRPSHIY